MKKISVPFPKSKFEQHHCSLAVFNCVDFRFRQEAQEAVERVWGPDFDYYSHPGGGKNFAAGINTIAGLFMRRGFVKAIQKVSEGLHGASTVLILTHWDCGAYGGSKAFDSPEAEEQAYQKDLVKAKLWLEKKLPRLTILVGYSKPIGDELEFIFPEGTDLAR